MSSAPAAVPVPGRDVAPGRVLPQSRPGLQRVPEQALLQELEPLLQEPVPPLQQALPAELQVLQEREPPTGLSKQGSLLPSLRHFLPLFRLRIPLLKLLPRKPLLRFLLPMPSHSQRKRLSLRPPQQERLPGLPARKFPLPPHSPSLPLPAR